MTDLQAKDFSLMHMSYRRFQRVSKSLTDLMNIQCAPGTWDQGAYMRGLANGLIMVDSIARDTRPHFLVAQPGERP